MTNSPTLNPLAGIRVLDFTVMPPGGACTVMLADLGAEVIRVEAPAKQGQPSLVVGQVALSRGKHSMTLDMRNKQSAEILRRLAPTVDIVVENARPGTMEARGFGYSQCNAANPGVIWCAITGFGQTGPYANHSGHDLSYIAHSGLLGALSADLPWQPGISLALQSGALSAVISIQSALIQRGRSGKGAFIDLSLSEAATWLLTCGINPLSDNPLMMPASPDRRLYQCADGRFVAVACAEPRTWGALCDGLALTELKPRLHKAEYAEETTSTLAEKFITRPAAEWVELLANQGAAVTIVNHGSSLLDDPHIQARNAITEVAGAKVPSSPIRISAEDGAKTTTTDTSPPKVGEHTVDILKSVGFSASEITDLKESGLI